MENLIDSLIDALGLTDANRRNESGCTLYEGIAGSGSDVHHTLRCIYRDSQSGFIQEIDWCDSYRSVWISIFHRCTLTYCEGDLTLSVAPDTESFYNELASAAKFYKEN
jgi:hypothetical protein